MKMSIEEATRVMGATLVLGKGPRAQVAGASIDSRSISPGELFFAITGEFLDGHDFAEDASRKGAAGVVVSREVSTDGDQLIVADPAVALVRLASWVRDSIDPLVVGVTGSVGKTSTKDLLHAVAAERYSTVAATGSFNNDLGVPLTLLRTLEETEVLV
ncbi:MAG: Mur ligase domain-containing protein, partial [Actinomycetota bacterium]